MSLTKSFVNAAISLVVAEAFIVRGISGISFAKPQNEQKD